MDNTNSINDNILLQKICQEYFSKEEEREVYVPVSEEAARNLVPQLPDFDIVLIGLFAVENFEGIPGFTLFYVLEKRGYRNIVILQRRLQGTEVESAAAYFPSACWFEREIHDGFGINFSGSFDSRRLFLHEAYPPGFHPLLKKFKNQPLSEAQRRLGENNRYIFKEVQGEGVYNVLVGPVHAGIIEPGHFHFSVIGETIAALEIRMFYKHRGIEKLAEGKTPAEAVAIAETISGDESAVNALAFCLAVEKIGGAKIPEKANYLRTILLEMERIYSHLGDLSGMIVDVAFSAGASEFGILREEILRYNSLLTGSRFLKGIICPGGLKRDISYRYLLQLTDYLEIFQRRFQQASDFIHRRDSVIDRMDTTGVIKPELINSLNITGPAARACGAPIDTRVNHPYGIYPALGLTARTSEKGDVLARFDVKVAEVLDSVRIVRRLISDSADLLRNEVYTEVPLKDGYSLVLVEAPRGQSLHWVYLKNGVIERYKIRTASFCNWQAIEHAVIGNIVPDFPLINKSLNLSYAGTDL